MVNKNYVGKNTKLLSVIYDIKLKELYEKFGVTRQYFSLLMNGDKNMKLDHIIIISEHFKIDLETLVKKDLTSKIKDFLEPSIKKTNENNFNYKKARKIRRNEKLSLRKLAKEIGVSQQCLSNYERGSTIPDPYNSSAEAYLNWLKRMGYDDKPEEEK